MGGCGITTLPIKFHARLPIFLSQALMDKDVYKVQFNDWMYLVTPKVMLNKAQMSKFGIYLGEVTLSFYKR